MAMRLNWSSFAHKRISEIVDYYEEKASPRVAKKLVDGIFDHASKLSYNPFIGQIEEKLEEEAQMYRYLVYKSYKIIYWINEEENTVNIVNVFDTRQDPGKMRKML